jgi:tetratricopeptide (TPR) repeat protein
MMFTKNSSFSERQNTMKNIARWLFVIWLACVYLLVSAQETITLTTYDDYLRMDLPATWVTSMESDDAGLGFFSVASSDNAMRVMQQNAQNSTNSAPASGDVAVIFMRERYLQKTLNIALADETPLDVLQQFIASVPDAQIEAVTIGQYEGVQTILSDDSSAGAIYALDLQFGGILVVAVSTASLEDFEAQQPIVEDILASLSFGGDAEAVIHTENGLSIAPFQWSPNGQAFAYGSKNGDTLTVTLMTVSNDIILTQNGIGVAWNGDGSQAIIYGGNNLPVINTTSGETAFTIASNAKFARWSASGKWIVTGDLRTGLVLVDASNGDEILRGETAQVWQFNADETLLATWNYAGDEVIVYDLSIGEIWRTSRTPTYFNATTNIPEVSWSGDGTRLLVIQAEVPTLFDAQSGAIIADFPSASNMKLDTVQNTPQTFVLGYQSNECTITNCSGELLVVNATTGTETVRLSDETGPFGGVSFSSDGQLLAISTRFNQTSVSLLDVASGESLWKQSFDISALNVSLHWLDEGRLLADFGSTITPILDVRDGTVLFQNLHDKSVDEVIINTNDTLLLRGDEMLRLINTNTGEQVVMPHLNKVTDARLSADNQFVYSTTQGGTFNVWDVVSGRKLVSLNERISLQSPDAILFTDISTGEQKVATGIVGAKNFRLWALQSLIVTAQETLASSPTANELQQQLEVARNEKNFEQVVELALQWIEADPDNILAYNQLAFAYFDLNREKDAENTLEFATRIAPASFDSRTLLGSFHRRTDNPFQARAEYEKALLLATTDAQRGWVNNLIGLTYSSDEKTYPEAIEYFTNAITLDPTLAVAYSNRGYMYYFQGESFYAEALADFEQHVTLAGDRANADVLELIKTLKTTLSD